MSWIKFNTCYVIMPFSSTKTHTEKEWEDTFQNLFKPTIESLGYSCYRSKASVGLILRGIIESIHSSEVILADLTDSKPNVFYELGIAHAMTNSVIMVSQDLSSIPSDLKPYGVIQYDPNTKEGAIEFTRNVSEALQRLHQQDPKPAGPVYEFLKLTHRKMEHFYHAASNPVVYMECAKCHTVYEVPLNGMTHGAGDIPSLCQHWEPAIFRGIKGINVISRG